MTSLYFNIWYLYYSQTGLYTMNHFKQLQYKVDHGNGVNETYFKILSDYVNTCKFDKISDHGYNDERIVDTAIRNSHQEDINFDIFNINYMNSLFKSRYIRLYGERHVEIPTVTDTNKNGFKILKYTVGEYFKKHIDNPEYGDLTAILCIVPPIDGGELEIETNDEWDKGLVRDYKRITFKENTLTIFNKELPHQSLPVLAGQKIVIVFPLVIVNNPPPTEEEILERKKKGSMPLD